MDDLQRAEHIQQIHATLEQRETEDLLKIYQQNNRDEWTPEAFEAIRQILLERNASIPDQAPLEEEEEVDSFSDGDSLINLASRAKELSWVFILLFFVLVVVDVLAFLPTLLSRDSAAISIWPFLIGLIASLGLCGFFWVALQAIGEMIYLFMDIEENTRRK
jgi:hypothetical protein